MRNGTLHGSLELAQTDASVLRDYLRHGGPTEPGIIFDKSSAQTPTQELVKVVCISPDDSVYAGLELRAAREQPDLWRQQVMLLAHDGLHRIAAAAATATAR